MTVSIFDLFKIGIGPSSSHTVGPMVAARRFSRELQASQLLDQTASLRIELFGSLALTGEGHGTPSAIVLGLEGDTPDRVNVDFVDARIAQIQAQQQIRLLQLKPIEFQWPRDILFNKSARKPFHANAVNFVALDETGETLMSRLYYSVGGGFVVEEGEAGREGQEQQPLPLPLDYHSAVQLLELAEAKNLSLSELVRCNESQSHSPEEISDYCRQIWQVMNQCVQDGVKRTGLLPGKLKVERRAASMAAKLPGYDSIDPKDPLQVMDWVGVFAIAVCEENADGRRMVTAPTNGAAGIIPAVLLYYYHFVSGANEQGIEDFLLTATAIGSLYKENASISGAEVGCQGEVGSACSMAAAGLAAVLGATPRQIENAAEIAMEHNLGLTCDPVGGLVQIPCIERNAVAAIKAIQSARIALKSDGVHKVSLDKVIQTMRDTGEDMSSKYKETAEGGLATHVEAVPVNIIEC